MNPYYQSYISTAKALAEKNGLSWNLRFDSTGLVSDDSRWNLTHLVGMIPPPIRWLSTVGVDPKSFAALNKIRRDRGLEELVFAPLSSEWRFLYQAVLLHQLLISKNKPNSALKAANAIRQLGQAARDTHPWLVTGDEVRQAYNAVLQGTDSGKVALDFKGVVKNLLHGQHIADVPALHRFCTPYQDGEPHEARSRALEVVQNKNGGRGGLRQLLAERKAQSKLPDERAFWELIRIIYTEKPKSFSDMIAFAAYKLQIIMGFRIGECATLPLDWKRWVHHVDSDGKPAGDRGGVSKSLMIRHFAEKQTNDKSKSGIGFYENTAHVPDMFMDDLISTLDHVAAVTVPLRERLKRQTETGRIFPEYDLSSLVSATEMYVRLSGNALYSDTPIPSDVIEKYKENYDSSILQEIRDLQVGKTAKRLSSFWFATSEGRVPIRHASGVIMEGRIDWSIAVVKVEDVELYVRNYIPTKLSDLQSVSLTDGKRLYPYELMFISPVRNLIETRNGGLLDTNLYASIGRIDPRVLLVGLSDPAGAYRTVFEKYGKTDEDRALRMLSHSNRHLQNTELFRLGIADTIITKKFNRNSVQQSYVYDHRSLWEDLVDIDLPPEAEDRLGEKAAQVYKMISANKVRGPVVDEFRSVQREYGDEAAFDFLNAEADGLHATPYGFCLNSFTSDPCPKHLECFNGCMHLARTAVASEETSLIKMRDRYAKILVTLEGLPEGRRNIGWANQIRHARERYDNILRALATKPGEQVFPEGKDLSVTAEQMRGNSIIDIAIRQREIND